MKPIVVIHETGVPIQQALRELQSASSGVSYHVLITRDGIILYGVASNMKAFAAANTEFNGESINNSVDDFAYQIALESPEVLDPHQGYTEEQYMSLAMVVAATGIEDDRITTHTEIDTTGYYEDPINFDKSKLYRYLNRFTRTKQIDLGVEDV
jgi:N-acetyl-anhydromuramyl-L-alanine amidase AmpD